MSRLPGDAPPDAAHPPEQVSPELGRQLGGITAQLHAGPRPPGFGTWTERDHSLVEECTVRIEALHALGSDNKIVELAELDASRTRAMEAEVRALRAQISPHFIYNSLGAIASFVRTDPDRARDLLLEFADFTRYSFRSHGEYTTLAEELRSVERYLLLEQARFGDRLQVTLSIAPEVLPVAVPFLCIQPLVENAVRHGLANVEGAGHVRIVALDRSARAKRGALPFGIEAIDARLPPLLPRLLGFGGIAVQGAACLI